MRPYVSSCGCLFANTLPLRPLHSMCSSDAQRLEMRQTTLALDASLHKGKAKSLQLSSVQIDHSPGDCWPLAQGAHRRVADAQDMD